MQKVCPKIDNIKIAKSNIIINRNHSKNFKLNVECRGKVGMPKDESENSLLLNIIMSISSVDSDDIKVEFDADIIFSYEKEPKDFDKMVESECMPMAQNYLFEKLDTLLVELGYSKLKLNERH